MRFTGGNGLSGGRVALLLPLLAAAPALAQDFATEINLGFGYLGAKSEEPVVATDGVVSDRYAYREDSSGRSLALAATRYFGGVPDDGTTPLALLPFVARRSWLGAGVSLAARSRDSYGIALGIQSTIESRFTADRSETSGSLDSAFFLRPELAIHATLSRDSFRETASYVSVSSPSGVSLGGSTAPKFAGYGGRLGVLARPTPEIALELAAFGETGSTKRTDVDFLARRADFRSDAFTLGVSVTGRLLLAGRRLAVDGAASYGAAHGDSRMTQPPEALTSTSHAIMRAISGAATCFPLRTLGVTLGADYSASGHTSGYPVAIGGGPGGERRVAAVREVVWRASVRFFPRARASVSLTASRTTADTVTPPDSASFQRIRDTDDRVALEAALRF